jgi:hypothetical protein
MRTTPVHPTLAELEAAHKSLGTTAYDKGYNERRLTSLKGIYARKCAQLDAFNLLFEETNPDFVLRGPNSPELVLRIPLGDTGCVMAALREALENGLKALEAEIITAHLDAEDEASYPSAKEFDLRPAILALCVPTATDGTTPIAEVFPPSSLSLPAGQRLFATPPTRPRAGSAAKQH